jgi:hypothetical protein
VIAPVESVVAKRLVEDAVPEKKLVEVPFPTVRRPMFAFVLKRFVLDAVAANEFVVVAAVPVAVVKVNAWSVVEPETNIEPRFSKSAPVVVVADPPKTTEVAAFG